MKGSLLKLKKVALYATIAGCLVGASKMNAKAARPLSDGIYKISSVANSKFSLKAADWDKDKGESNVALGATKDVAEQAFRFTYYAKEDCYYIRNISNGYLLEAASSESGANVMLRHPANYSDKTKQWVVAKQSNGSYILYNKASYKDAGSKRIEVAGGYTAEGNNIQMYYEHQKYITIQTWNITKAADNITAMNGYIPQKGGQTMGWSVSSSNFKGYDAYMIDLYPSTEKNDNVTYWALAQFYMNNDGFINKIGGKKVDGAMTAYGGIQDTEPKLSDAKIHSIWDMKYKDKNGVEKSLQPHRMYPYGPEDRFGNEGVGSRHIEAFPLSFKRWYRGLVRCWNDSQKGTTFVGMWLQDKATGRWENIAYYDTGLYDSYINNYVAGFMECYITNRWGVRSAQLKNIYFMDHDTKKWASADKVNVHVTYAKSKSGSHEAMVKNGTVYMESGERKEDQSSYDLNHAAYGSYTVSHDSTMGINAAPTVSTLGFTKQNSEFYVYWTVPAASNPQLSYSVSLMKDGKTIATKSATRPEIKSVSFGKRSAGKYVVVLKVTDVFNQTTTVQKTFNYS